MTNLLARNKSNVSLLMVSILVLVTIDELGGASARAHTHTHIERERGGVTSQVVIYI